MPNTLQVVDWMTVEGLRILQNNLQIAGYMTQTYTKEYRDHDFAVGDTIRVPLPYRFLVTDGLGWQPQALSEQNVTITIDQPFGVHFELDALDIALRMPMQDAKAYLKKKVLKPAMAALAQSIDSRAALWVYQNTNNIVGALGTTPTTMETYQQARQRLVENACPPQGSQAAGRLMDVGMFISPGMNTKVGTALATVFNPSETVDFQFKNGFIKQGAGADWYESMSLYTHTAGTWAAGVTVNGANQNGSSLLITATASDTFNVGDVISIANVNNVNPQTRRSTGSVKNFVVTQALTATGGGSALDALQIAPAIVGPGSQYQNVDALPATGAALTLFPGTTSPNGKSGINGLNFHQDAFAICGVPLYEPKACEMSSTQRDPETGLSLSFLQMIDPITRKLVNRFDCLIGFGNLYADNLSVRVLSSN